MATTTTTTSISLSPPDFHFLSILDPKPNLFLKTHKSSLSLPSQTTRISSKTSTLFHNPPHKIKQQNTPIWRIHATASGDAPPLEATPLDTSQQIVSTGDENASVVISVLLFTAFIGLSILTVGIIYIGVTDFLQKREREKFEKEEEAAGKKKGGGKKKKMRSRAGPRGFGQKVDEDSEFDD